MPIVPMIAFRSSALRSDAVSAESGTNFGGADAPDAAPPAQPASTQLSASAPNRLTFTGLRVRPGRGTRLLDPHSLVVHLGGGGVQTFTGNTQPHLDEQLGCAE